MSVFFKNPKHQDSASIKCVGNYRPWWWHKDIGGDSTNYPELSSNILNLKRNRTTAVDYFFERLNPRLKQSFAISVVPSHDPANTTGGLYRLVARLTQNSIRTDASHCLRRFKKIKKLAAGGDRSMDVHLKSVRVENDELINNRDVLLLDDVTTSGHSILACRKLLLAAGARSVQGLALGRTTYD